MWIFYLFAAIVVWLGIASVLSGLRFLTFVRREVNKPLVDFTPRLSIISPCRGLDQGLKANLTSLFLQDYPAFEIVFVTDSADDPAIEVIEEVIHEFREWNHVKTRVVISGPAIESGQKVHNLRAAVSQTDPESEAFVFVDSDARPGTFWLRSIIAPLANDAIGAATGYRWFIPESGGLGSHLRSVWNASIASALSDRTEKNFCWGGSTAILRNTFERLKIVEQWRGTLSDDFAMTRALQSAKLPIQFVPACLTASIEDCGVRELFEFTTRQLKITRVYASHLWKAVLIGSSLFVSVFFGGTVLVIVLVVTGRSYMLPLSLLIVIFLLGAWKALIRLQALRIAIPHYENQIRNGTAAHLVLWPLASALYLYNSLCAAFSRRIHWRGITYELKSPNETVIMRDSHR